MGFDKKYKVYTWKHWMMLHWILNPGVAYLEIIQGQRVPKVTLEDITVEKPRVERTFVPCPHCGKLHDCRTWSTMNGTAYQNWFGLYCPNCGEVIPCLLNLTTLFLLAVTFPIWGWFKHKIKGRWAEAQPLRYQNLDLESIPKAYEGTNWVKLGLGWGLFMFVFMTFLLPLYDGKEITWLNICVGIPVWTLSGIGFGYSMKFLMGRVVKRAIEGRHAT